VSVLLYISLTSPQDERGRQCREKALLKAVQDPELVQVMPGGVKLSMPGLQKAAQRSKKGKKG
jgi:hypothetical protein